MSIETKGTILSFKRFEIHDGDGIRTTLFLKGCPLSCRWCHNPESISAVPVLAFYQEICTSCGRCVSVCEEGCHQIDEVGIHHFKRERCLHCGKCARVCPPSALVLYGETITVGEALEKLLQDRPFYEASGGGVTLSGGEPLRQVEFCRDLLAQLKEQGISTAVDTCGFVPRSAIDAVLPYTDVFLYDVKAMDEAVHLRVTGQSNQLILENLRYIDQAGKKIEVRIPFVVGYNDGEVTRIAEFLQTLKSLVGVKLLPYHDYAQGKYEAIGCAQRFADISVPTDEQTQQAREILHTYLPKIKIE